MSEVTVASRPTSIAALASIEPATSGLRGIIFQVIDSEPNGVTCDRIEEALNMRHQTCSARITELSQRGLIIDSLRRRKTRSGRTAVVWVTKQKGA